MTCSHRLRRSAMAISIGMAIWACLGPDAPSVTVTTDRDHYTLLDPVLVTIANRTSESVYQELCEGALEGYGYEPGRWTSSYGEVHSCANPAGVAIRAAGSSLQAAPSSTPSSSMLSHTRAGGVSTSGCTMPLAAGCLRRTGSRGSSRFGRFREPWRRLIARGVTRRCRWTGTVGPFDKPRPGPNVQSETARSLAVSVAPAAERQSVGPADRRA
jgi:hypothetical protein